MNAKLEPRSRSAGFTLIELTMAMVLFLLVLGFTAEVLVNYYVSMDLTQQRATAVQNGTSVLNSTLTRRVYLVN